MGEARAHAGRRHHRSAPGAGDLGLPARRPEGRGEVSLSYGTGRGPKRLSARWCALRCSASRFRGGALVRNAWIRRWAAVVTSSTARLNTAAFAWEGRVVPLSLRTNCSDDARISSSVAGGSKLASVLMFLHMCCSSLVDYRLQVKMRLPPPSTSGFDHHPKFVDEIVFDQRMYKPGTAHHQHVIARLLFQSGNGCGGVPLEKSRVLAGQRSFRRRHIRRHNTQV